jgi:preprotein translocase subunit SecB
MKKAQKMAKKEGNIISDNVKANGEDTAPAVGMLSQYIKDLSVENPNAPQSYQWEEQPQIDVQVNIQVNSVSDEVHEVAIALGVKAASDQGVHFNVELD